MNAKEAYKLKLETNYWKATSRKIKTRDLWTCNMCENNCGIIHVHHIIYTTPDPWDEPDENLITLCADCHEWVHSYQEDTGLNFYTNGRMD